MSIIIDKRISRMNWIKQTLARIIEKEKQSKFNQEEMISEIMCRFYTSRRTAIEDINAVKRFLRF